MNYEHRQYMFIKFVLEKQIPEKLIRKENCLLCQRTAHYFGVQRIHNADKEKCIIDSRLKTFPLSERNKLEYNFATDTNGRDEEKLCGKEYFVYANTHVIL